MKTTWTTVRLAALAALCSVGAAATAADLMAHRKPGLWEIQGQAGGATVDAMNKQMEAMMANMPAEQRARMEAAMKKRGAAAGGMGATHFRYCLSPEKAAKESFAKPEPDADCTQQITQSSATEVKFSFSCKRKDGSSEQGEGRAWNISPEGYQLSLQMSGTERNGKPMDLKVEQTAKWLGADCQGVKYSAGG